MTDLMYLNSLRRAAVYRLGHPLRAVVADGDEGEIDGPQALPDLRKDRAVSGVARKPCALGLASHMEASPQRPPLVISKTRAPMLEAQHYVQDWEAFLKLPQA